MAFARYHLYASFSRDRITNKPWSVMHISLSANKPIPSTIIAIDFVLFLVCAKIMTKSFFMLLLSFLCSAIAFVRTLLCALNAIVIAIVIVAYCCYCYHCCWCCCIIHVYLRWHFNQSSLFFIRWNNTSFSI